MSGNATVEPATGCAVQEHAWPFPDLQRVLGRPRIDRQLPEIDADSDVAVIASAGCNVLDYLLDDPRSISAADVNPRQNALLELKLAMIRRGRYEDFFAAFGRGGTIV